MKGGPIQFLVAVAILWGVARSTIVWNTPDQMADDLKLLIAWADPPAHADVIEPKQVPLSPRVRLTSIARPWRAPRLPSEVARARISDVGRTTFTLVRPQQSPGHAAAAPAPANAVAPFPLAPPAAGFAPRLTLSSWAIARGSGASSLASGGQLGGSQAGVRATFALSPHLAAAGRVSAPLRERGAEAALALDWRPIRSLPVTLTAERRIRIDRGGRNAFAVGLFGGVDAIPLPAAFRLDAYAQAGIVGLKRRDAYIDGALRLDRPIAELGHVTIAAGGGIWGAAQPGAGRLDIGPQLVARLPAGATNLRIGLDWRQRVAGDARPGSGPALSIGADF